jgi:hypothetical protein
MRTDLEHVYREHRLYRIEIVQPAGPTFLPTFLRALLGETIPVGGDHTKLSAQEKAERLRELYRRNPHNEHIVKIRSIFD